MKKITFFLSVFLLSFFYSNAQECGIIEFPRVISDSVCTSDTILLATDEEIGQNNILGNGVFYNEAVYFTPVAEDVGQTIYLKIYGQDTCNQFVQDSVPVFVRGCENCITFEEFANPVPDTICHTDDPVLLAEGNDFEHIIPDNEYIEVVGGDYYFNPSLSPTDTIFTIGLTVFNACEDSFYVSQSVYIDACTPPCETVSFVNSLPDSICNNDSRIYLTSSVIYDVPIEVSGKGVYAEALNGGLDFVYYFDPSLVSSSDYDTPFLVLIQAYDECQSQALDSITVYNCSGCSPEIRTSFTTLPDTICSDIEFVRLVDVGPDESNDNLYVFGDGIVGYALDSVYFNLHPDFVGDSEATFTVVDSNYCDISKTYDLVIKDCPASCETASFVNSLPDSICNDSSNSIYLTSSTLYESSITVTGKGVYAEAQNGGLDSAYYFDPSLVTPSDYNQFFDISIQANDDCESQAVESIMVYDCVADSCITFEEFANPVPDTICGTADPILIAEGSNYELIIPTNDYIEEVNGDYYFNPSLSATDTLLAIGLTVFNSCQDSFYVEQSVYVEDCQEDCGMPQFANSLPDEICGDDPAIYLTSTDLYDFPISVTGDGVVVQALNGGVDSAYYFVPALISGTLPQYPLILITVEDDCGNYVQDSTAVIDCIDSCAIVPEFPFLLPDSICFSTSPIIFEALNALDMWGDGIVYDGGIEFDPSVPATNHYAVIYASVENYCQEEVVVSDTIFISSCSVNAIHDFTGERMEIYPNPVKSQLTISGEGIKSVQLKDITGKTVFIQHNTQLDLSSLSNGVYFLQIELQNGVIKTEKIIKE